MLKDVELFVCLLILFMALMVIFYARWMIKNKVKKEVENKVVETMKIVAFIVCIGILLVIYFIK